MTRHLKTTMPAKDDSKVGTVFVCHLLAFI
jgi:hypothetical protein